MAQYIRDLSAEKLKTAEAARAAAVQIVQDALKKGMYGFPVSFHYTCSEPVDPYKFSCIPTEAFLRDLLGKMQAVGFKEDVNPKYSDVFAYVNTGKDPHNVYLCNLFWDSPQVLCVDSQPGTLIHEVSHLLKTKDITYELIKVELWEDHGTLLGKSQKVKDSRGKIQYQEEVAQINANSLEYEFEIVVNHQKKYRNGKYECCGETKMHSLCSSQPTAHYRLYKDFPYRAKEMEKRLDEYGSAEGGWQYAKIKNKACRKTRV